MKKITKWLLVAIVMVTSTAMFSQGKLTGVVKDSDGALPGASVLVSGTTKGATTDFDGKFTLDVNSASGTIEVSFLGYKTKKVSFSVSGTLDLGTIMLEADSETLSEVVVTGVIDLATERKTPVAVSTIRAADIQEKLGAQEFPEILNNTPSVYATKQGGGFGDARINIRGFDQRNTAVLINGVPVNDMENGWVYWSNWAGLSDVTTAMQVQRGLGSSKLAISSVGGTINVVTKTTEQKQGGTFSTTVGNDEYIKATYAYNTGKLDNGFAASVLFSHTTGAGYTDGTEFEGSNYFIGLGYEPNEKNNLQFVFTGAPQWHNQHSRAYEIKNHIKYNPAHDGQPDFRFNDNWGYRNGKEFTWRRNFYHKPVMSVNWDYKASEKSTLSTIVYGSWGRGGGTGPIGKINGGRDYYSKFRDPETGLLRFDDYATWNSGGNVPAFGSPRTPNSSGQFVNDRSNGFTRRASMNSHNWYGTIINYETVLNENLTYSVGADLRAYKGVHYRVVNDVLGADDYLDNRDHNNPNRIIGSYVEASPSWNPFQNITDQEKIEYYNDGKVRWAGVFGQIEYSKDKFTGFIQGSYSSQGYKRVEYFKEPPATQETSWENITGGNIKGGLNINIDDNNNVFFNSGYYSRQPNFDAVYINYGNNLNPDVQNEKVFAQEFGYGFRNDKLSVHFNAYNTSWKNRWITRSVSFGADRGTANFRDVEEVHTGVELDFKYRPTETFNLNGMVSVGNWRYKNNITADVYDTDQKPLGSATLFLDNVKVGDAAQFTSSLGFTFKMSQQFKWDGNWRHTGNLYAKLNPTDFTAAGKQALELPDYDLFNTGFSYKFNTKHQKVFDTVSMRLNVNNVLNTHYISESATSKAATNTTTNWRGVNVDNRVYFGWGRTYNFSVRFKF